MLRAIPTWTIAYRESFLNEFAKREKGRKAMVNKLTESEEGLQELADPMSEDELQA
jgi:hypothetical protein